MEAHGQDSATFLLSQEQKTDRKFRPIVLACDSAYAMPLATALRSIVESNQSYGKLDFYVLSEGVSEATKSRVFDSLPQGSASIHWIPVDIRKFQQYATLVHISKMTFARFLIQEVFDDSVSRALYLDVDLLVLDDLSPVWNTDLEGAVVGAVSDHVISKFGAADTIAARIPPVRDYFNAGVLLIDMDQWRHQRISEKALDYLSRNPHTPFSDQDALNVACDGLWKKLDGRWNYQNHFDNRFARMAQEDRPGIVHFISRSKPWIASERSVNAHFYDGFRRRTRYARTNSEKLEDQIKVVWTRFRNACRRLRVRHLLHMRWISE